MNRRDTLRIVSGSAAWQVLRAQSQDPAFLKAMQAVRDAIPTADADPERPVYHFHPPANWTNDPNGTIYYRGWHHLFYQLNPADARPGNQHWGHARSRDLVNWEHLPIAICPSTDKGERAIFSGGAALAGDGRPRLIYTSIGHPQPEQWMMIPKDEDLFYWEKYAGNPVLTQSAHIAGPISQWRDPFMFRKDGKTYMVCGGAANSGRAQVQLYQATKPDLTEWKHLGPIFQALDRDIRNFECPNLFPLDGRFVMIVSPNRVCEYWIGDLDIQKMQFQPSAHGVLDAGDSYASNISVDDKGRTILWLWGRTNTPPGRGWASVITMPRLLSIGADGFLRQTPAPEFESLRGPETSHPVSTLGPAAVVENLATDCAEIQATFSGAGSYGLELRRSREGKSGVVVSIQGGYVNVGSARAFVGNAERYDVRIFLDKRCLEVFVNGGVTATYNWFEAGANDTGIAVFGQAAPPGRGGFGRAASPPSGAAPARINPVAPKLESLKVWQMKPAKFSMEHFHA